MVRPVGELRSGGLLLAVTLAHLAALMLLAMQLAPPKSPAVMPAPVSVRLLKLESARPAMPVSAPMAPQAVPRPEPAVVTKASRPAQAAPRPQRQAQSAARAPSLSRAPSQASTPVSTAAHTAAPAAAESWQPPSSDATSLHNPRPVYPLLSRRLQEEGTVLLQLEILASGQLTAVSIRQSSGYARLDQAALAAVRNWRYAPARQNGLAVAARYVQPITFSLND